jgi:predicted nucleic acid-binding protein
MLLIADTTVISNFAYANKLDLLKSVGNTCTTMEVMIELQAAKIEGVLQIGFSNLFIEILKMDEDERETFVRLNSKFGRGEASCLAIALHRNAGILTDDLDARRFAQQGCISVSGSVGILVKAIDRGQLSKEQGNHLLHLMIAKGYYSPVETLDQFFSK